MKLKYISQLITLIFTIFIIGCNQGKKSDIKDEKTILTVTIDPLRYFLEQIVGDNFIVKTLVPPGTSPETYEPAPSLMVDMSKSELYFIVGDLGFEKAWSKRLIDNNQGITIVDCSQGVHLIEGVEHHHEEDLDHNHVHGEMDPHTWTSPDAVKMIAENMLNSIIDFDPENRTTYISNYRSFLEKVNRTDSIINELLTDSPVSSFIIFHPSLGYFANHYDLHQYSIEFEGKNPSPAQIKTLIDTAGKDKINTVFIQKGFDEKNAEVIAKEINADIFEIDPLTYSWDTELIKIAEILTRDRVEGK